MEQKTSSNNKTSVAKEITNGSYNGASFSGGRIDQESQSPMDHVLAVGLVSALLPLPLVVSLLKAKIHLVMVRSLPRLESLLL